MALVRIQDTIHLADGDLAPNGTANISWTSFTSAQGQQVLQGNRQFAVIAGVIDLELQANVGATPSGTSYKVMWDFPGIRPQPVEYWNVPATGPVDLADIRTILAPSPSPVVAASQIIYTPPGTGAVARTVQSRLQDFMSVKDFGAVGDGTTNDTTAIQAAFTYLGTSGGGIYFPVGVYMVSAVTITATSQVSIRGEGKGVSRIRRHASALQQATDMVTITTSSGVSVDSMGFDQRGDGSTFQKAAVSITGATSLSFTNNYVTGGQAVGLQGVDCDNVIHTGNHYYQNWWFGASFASSSPTSAPVYHKNYTSCGNVYENMPIGLGFNFFLSDITVSGEIFQKSGLDFVQMPQARASVSNIVIEGTSTYGFTSNPQDGIFCEGVSQISISDVRIRNITSQAGIRFQGSTLTIPGGGTTIQLPCNYVTVENIFIDSVTANYPIAIAAASTSGTSGVNYTQRNVTITNSHSGGAISSLNHLVISGLFLDTTNVGGLTISACQDFELSDFKFRNVGVSSPGSYAGILATTCLNGYIRDGIITSDGGNSLAYCLQDVTLNAGTATQIRISDVQFSGGALSLPTLAAPTLGTWNAGDIVQINSVGFVCLTAGTPGVWNAYTSTPFTKGAISSPGQTASISSTNLNSATLTSGQYRLSWRMRSVSVAATPGPGQVVLSITWIDELFSVSTTLGTLALGATVTNPQQGVYVLLSTGPNITYSAAYTPCTTGTGTYSLQIELEKLQ
jgi:polygalacturonase